MADEKSASSVLPLKRKATSEIESPPPSLKSVKRCEGDSESDSDSDRPKDEIVPVAKPDIQIFQGFLPNNVTLMVEGKHLHLNEDLLSSASPVFAAWLKKEWQQDECTGDTKKELKFPGKTYDEMATFLKCLLPIFADQVTNTTLATVLPLADEYQTENVLKECAELIMKHAGSVFETDIYITPLQVVTYLRWIDQHNLNTAEKCVVKLASFLDTKEIQAVPDYINVSKGLQLEVSDARAKLLESLMACSTSVTETARVMYQLRIPLSPQYMPGWKRNLEETVKASLKKVCAKDSEYCYGYNPENFPYFKELDSNMELQVLPSHVVLFACIHICDRFNFSESYAKCISKLHSMEIYKSEFKKLWEARYSTDSNKVRDCTVLQMCRCT